MSNDRNFDDATLESQLRAVNEALLISSIRQSELLEEALRAEAALRETDQELRTRVEELARFNEAAVGRELRIIELKGAFNNLAHRHGEPTRYSQAEEAPPRILAQMGRGTRSAELADADERIATLESILCTEELALRPSRSPDYASESRALSALGVAMTDSRHDILQRLAEVILATLRVGSAGVSVLTPDGQRFHWPAIAGAWRPHIGGGTPSDFGPCGDVLDRNTPLLFRDVERRYTYFRAVTPAIKECLLVPFYVDRVAAGTIWAVAHDDHEFDAEDLRLLQSLGVFASAAHMTAGARRQERSRNVAALNLMEDAVEARRSAESAMVELGESERRLRQVLDSLPAAVYTTDAQGFVTHFNNAAVTLVGRQPRIGEDRWCVSWKMFNQDGTRLPHGECPMAIALKQGHAVRGAELIVERPDGTRSSGATYPTPLKDSNGAIIGAINMVIDITERALLESKARENARVLAELDRRKDEFLAMLSHELRNPLAAIVNVTRLLAFQKDSGAPPAEVLKMLDRQVTQLTRLVDDLLEVSRISTGRVRLQCGRVDLVEIAKRAIETTETQRTSKKQTLHISLPEEALWLHGDSTRLEQVIVNLLNNANKYSHDGGEIWVGVLRHGSNAVLSVRDNGIGISAEMLPRIFDLFTQAESSLDRSQGGLGIGLALVQSLVGLHDGEIEVRSIPQQGSEFIVTLPLLPSAESSTALPMEGEIAPGRPVKVLVVDDDVDAARSVAMLLEAAGHDTRVAYDAATALRHALERPPEVMLLDIGLPLVNGFELAERIRNEPTLSGVVLIAVTGYGRETDRQRSREAGFDHHLVKPVEFAKIQRILVTLSNPRQNAGA